MIPLLERGRPFPPVHTALRRPNGLLAAGGDLSPERLLAGYQRGIFPWYSPGEPILWWSPDPRMVLLPGDFSISRSLSKTLRNKPYEVRIDSSFRTVMEMCAAPRDGESGTWIGPEVIEAYCRLYRLGYGHSIETWMDGELVGGLYGVAVGSVFFGESMFSRRSDASKIALAHLVQRVENAGFGLIDCQMHTDHLASLGAHEIPRAEFCALVAELTARAPASDAFTNAPAPR